jgi:protein required for attachment to host cells
MKNIWVVVAKGDQAKVYAVKHHPRKLVLVTELEHPESRLKKTELIANEGGNHDTRPLARGNASFHSNPRRETHTAFAKQITEFLEQARNHQHFEELIIVADPQFHGFLNNEFSKPLQELISKHIQKNYIDLPEQELLAIIFAKPEYA